MFPSYAKLCVSLHEEARRGRPRGYRVPRSRARILCRESVGASRINAARRRGSRLSKWKSRNRRGYGAQSRRGRRSECFPPSSCSPSYSDSLVGFEWISRDRRVSLLVRKWARRCDGTTCVWQSFRIKRSVDGLADLGRTFKRCVHVSSVVKTRLGVWTRISLNCLEFNLNEEPLNCICARVKPFTFLEHKTRTCAIYETIDRLSRTLTAR